MNYQLGSVCFPAEEGKRGNQSWKDVRILPVPDRLLKACNWSMASCRSFSSTANLSRAVCKDTKYAIISVIST